MAPTRELALQIHREARKLCHASPLRPVVPALLLYTPRTHTHTPPRYILHARARAHAHSDP